MFFILSDYRWNEKGYCNKSYKETNAESYHNNIVPLNFKYFHFCSAASAVIAAAFHSGS